MSRANDIYNNRIEKVLREMDSVMLYTLPTNEAWWLFDKRFYKCRLQQGILTGGSITVPLTCLTGLESAVLELTIVIFICKTDYSKPVKQEANGTVILPPLVFPDYSIAK